MSVRIRGWCQLAQARPEGTENNLQTTPWQVPRARRADVCTVAASLHLCELGHSIVDRAYVIFSTRSGSARTSQSGGMRARRLLHWRDSMRTTLSVAFSEPVRIPCECKRCRDEWVKDKYQ